MIGGEPLKERWHELEHFWYLRQIIKILNYAHFNFKKAFICVPLIFAHFRCMRINGTKVCKIEKLQLSFDFDFLGKKHSSCTDSYECYNYKTIFLSLTVNDVACCSV